MPSVVNQASAEIAKYSWFADGSKFSIITPEGDGYYYIGSLIYASNGGNLQIESTGFTGGRINLAQTGSAASGTNNTGSTLTQETHYHHTDHLGSVRAITDNTGSVIEQNAYYPFGSRHTFGTIYAQTTNRFKFNGKEEQTTGNLQYLDYGARMYDNKIGRWLTQDPLAEKYYSQSPYNYCVNNPVMFVDPDGEDVRVTIQGNTVSVEANIILYQANGRVYRKTVNNIKKQINSAWNKGVVHPWKYSDGEHQYDVLFNVNVTAAETDARNLKRNFNGINNYIEIREGSDSSTSLSQVKNCQYGFFMRNTKQAAHEFGHILGLKDRYTKNENSLNRYTPDAGYEDNIMGAYGKDVSQLNINDFMQNVLNNTAFLNNIMNNYEIIYINVSNREK